MMSSTYGAGMGSVQAAAEAEVVEDLLGSTDDISMEDSPYTDLDMSSDTMCSLDSARGAAEADSPSAASPVSVGGLSVESSLPSPRVHAKNTLIIFDWDDTLMASSWLSRNGMGLEAPRVVPSHITTPMRKLGVAVRTILTSAIKMGQVVIITNAETGWVELSAQKFMPSVVPMLSQVKVVSARSTYEPRYPDSPISWKIAAFVQELHTFSRKDTTTVAKRRMRKLRQKYNVISFGDSVHERTAVHEACGGLGDGVAVPKSVKFVERPCAQQLRRQVELVSSCLHDICSHPSKLDLMLTIKLLEQQEAQMKAARADSRRI